MNAKERVHTVLEGVIPDRVPWGEYAIDFDTAEKILGHETYFRAKAKSRIAFWEGRHDEVAESWEKDHIELHEKIDCDIVTFPMATWQIPPESDDPPPRKVDDTTWEDEYGRIFRYSETTGDITCIKDPVAETQQFSIDDYSGEPSVPERSEKSWKIVDSVIKRFKDEKFICSPCGGEIGMVFLGGMERGMIEMIQNPELVRAVTAYRLKQQNRADELYVHPDADGVLWGADFGFKTGSLISPDMFRDFFLEPNRKRVENIHIKYGMKVMKHCCGNVNRLMDSFIEMGYDAYQSIQGTAGMDICELKKSYGDKIALWGGVSVENIISGTSEQVRGDVQRAMQCAKPGGGFIIGSSHSIAVGSKYDNFMAMLDEYHKLCEY